MTGITVLLLAAAAGYGAAKALRLPAVPFLLLAGFGVSFFDVFEGDFLETSLVLGVTILVFVAGLELNPTRVKRQRNVALKVGLGQFLLLGAAGFGAAKLFGFSLHASAYLALALTASSTLVVVRVLQNRKQLFEPFGRLVIGVLLLQDLLVILLIPVLTNLPQGSGAVAAGVAATIALVALAAAFLRWIAPLVLRLATDEESLLLIVLAVLFTFIGLSSLFELPLVAGAFLAGFALSPFPVSGLVRGQLNSVSDFFSAIFFTTLGASLVLPTPVELLYAVAFALLVLLITPVLVAVVAERSGLSARPAIQSGLLLSQTSEFSLVVGLQGIVLQQIAPSVFMIIVLVTVLTMMLTPLIATDRITWWLMRLQPLWQPERVAHPPEGHVLLLGCGSNGMALLETLAVGAYPVMVVEDDPAIIQRLRESYIPCVRGDVSDLDVLRSAGAERARVIISTIRRPEDNAPVLGLAGRVPVLVRGFNEEDLAWIRARGGIPISYAEAAADNFMQWFEDPFRAAQGHGMELVPSRSTSEAERPSPS